MKSNRDQVFNSSSYVMGTEIGQQQHQEMSVGAFSVVYLFLSILLLHQRNRKNLHYKNLNCFFKESNLKYNLLSCILSFFNCHYVQRVTNAKQM